VLLQIGSKFPFVCANKDHLYPIHFNNANPPLLLPPSIHPSCHVSVCLPGWPSFCPSVRSSARLSVGQACRHLQLNGLSGQLLLSVCLSVCWASLAAPSARQTCGTAPWSSAAARCRPGQMCRRRPPRGAEPLRWPPVLGPSASSSPSAACAGSPPAAGRPVKGARITVRH
jgi:hypothetical protein